jgi:hypothetical protein
MAGTFDVVLLASCDVYVTFVPLVTDSPSTVVVPPIKRMPFNACTVNWFVSVLLTSAPPDQTKELSCAAVELNPPAWE